MGVPLSFTDNLICEAYVWALDRRHRERSTRLTRLLHDDDFKVLRDLRAQLAQEWQVVEDKREGYYPWRKTKLDEIAKRDSWSDASRELYASMLSIISSWTRQGRSEKDEARLQELMVGAKLFLQFLNHYQPALF